MFPVTTKILVVDDTALMRRMMMDFFSSQGYKKVVQAPDGAEAWLEIEKAEREKDPFTLIISDWNMPKLNGLDLLKKVRMTPFCASVPYIMLTAETEKDKVVEALQAGVTNYITKPFTNNTVQTKLKQVYDKLFPVKKAG